MRIAVLLTTGMCLSACHERGWHADHVNHHFSNADDWAARFDDPARDAWQKPDEVISALGLSPEMKVADIGAATGYFSVRLARKVSKGHVYGIDIESSMIDYLTKRGEKEQLTNLSAILAEPNDPKIPEPVDAVIIVNTFHHLENRTAYFARVLAQVKPHARLAIIDFAKHSSMGPPASAKLEPAQVTAEVTAAGWKFEREDTSLPEQFFLLYTKP